jgi:hypothetical protein
VIRRSSAGVAKPCSIRKVAVSGLKPQHAKAALIAARLAAAMVEDRWKVGGK